MGIIFGVMEHTIIFQIRKQMNEVERCVANKHYSEWGLNGAHSNLKKKVSNRNPNPNHPFLVSL